MYGGKRCNKKERKEYKVCRKDKDIIECPRQSVAGYGQWHEWGDCFGKCGKRGVMERIRNCITFNGEGECEGEAKQQRDCPNMCPGSKHAYSLKTSIFSLI